MKTKENFVQKVIHSIENNGMITAGEAVIAGVSGGADSVCLLALLRIYQQQCPFSLSVVYVEHGIRGEESREDGDFVKQLCSDWQIPCEIFPVDVPSRARANGQTMEEAARQLRYEVFAQCSQRRQGAKIAVAHNQNDQAETVLLNLTRGSGLRGLGGILPMRTLELADSDVTCTIIRPLLAVSRKEIEDWLDSQGLAFRTDRTNLETDYTRNKLRLRILPELERGVNKEAVRHMAEAAAHLQKAERYLQRVTEEKFAHCVEVSEDGVQIHLPLFFQEDSLIQEYLLRKAIEKVLHGRGLKDYGELHIEEMTRLAGMDCGKRMDFPGGLQAVRKKKTLWLGLRKGDCSGCCHVAGKAGQHGRQELSDKTEQSGRHMAGESRKTPQGKTQPIREDGNYEFGGCRFQAAYLNGTENMQPFPEKKYTKWLAYDTMKNDVCLRTRKTGDYLIVNQAGGRKKLKDYMIDQKIPREERDRILLVAEGSHILWVVGWRISEGAKVTAQSQKILKVQMMEEEI